jgi:hypothetical protein
MIVMLCHFQQAFARDIAAAKDVFKKRDYIFAFFGASEGNQQECVV